ncbi:MAG TPA: hypothetical protein VJ902_04610 [Wenzhouxiangellaceae bacterium]|nr:hypothetical protein [Wenzhouxiangellaceae bacterium]
MRLIAVLTLLMPLLCVGQAEPVDGEPAPRYAIESAVWCSGQLRGEPELLLRPGIPGTFEIHSPDSSWRLSVEVDTPDESEGAIAESLWLKVGIEQRIDGRWEFLTDTMLGTPLGKPGIISVVEQGEHDSSRDTAPLYVEMTAQRI